MEPGAGQETEALRKALLEDQCGMDELALHDSGMLRTLLGIYDVAGKSAEQVKADRMVMEKLAEFAIRRNVPPAILYTTTSGHLLQEAKKLVTRVVDGRLNFITFRKALSRTMKQQDSSSGLEFGLMDIDSLIRDFLAARHLKGKIDRVLRLQPTLDIEDVTTVCLITPEDLQLIKQTATTSSIISYISAWVSYAYDQIQLPQDFQRFSNSIGANSTYLEGVEYAIRTMFIEPKSNLSKIMMGISEFPLTSLSEVIVMKEFIEEVHVHWPTTVPQSVRSLYRLEDERMLIAKTLGKLMLEKSKIWIHLHHEARSLTQVSLCNRTVKRGDGEEYFSFEDDMSIEDKEKYHAFSPSSEIGAMESDKVDELTLNWEEWSKTFTQNQAEDWKTPNDFIKQMGNFANIPMKAFDSLGFWGVMRELADTKESDIIISSPYYPISSKRTMFDSVMKSLKVVFQKENEESVRFFNTIADTVMDATFPVYKKTIIPSMEQTFHGNIIREFGQRITYLTRSPCIKNMGPKYVKVGNPEEVKRIITLTYVEKENIDIGVTVDIFMRIMGTDLQPSLKETEFDMVKDFPLYKATLTGDDTEFLFAKINELRKKCSPNPLMVPVVIAPKSDVANNLSMLFYHGLFDNIKNKGTSERKGSSTTSESSTIKARPIASKESTPYTPWNQSQRKLDQTPSKDSFDRTIPSPMKSNESLRTSSNESSCTNIARVKRNWRVCSLGGLVLHPTIFKSYLKVLDVSNRGVCRNKKSEEEEKMKVGTQNEAKESKNEGLEMVEASEDQSVSQTSVRKLQTIDLASEEIQVANKEMIAVGVCYLAQPLVGLALAVNNPVRNYQIVAAQDILPDEIKISVNKLCYKIAAESVLDMKIAAADLFSNPIYKPFVQSLHSIGPIRAAYIEELTKTENKKFYTKRSLREMLAFLTNEQFDILSNSIVFSCEILDVFPLTLSERQELMRIINGDESCEDAPAERNLIEFLQQFPSYYKANLIEGKSFNGQPWKSKLDSIFSNRTVRDETCNPVPRDDRVSTLCSLTAGWDLDYNFMAKHVGNIYNQRDLRFLFQEDFQRIRLDKFVSYKSFGFNKFMERKLFNFNRLVESFDWKLRLGEPIQTLMFASPTEYTQRLGLYFQRLGRWPYLNVNYTKLLTKNLSATHGDLQNKVLSLMRYPVLNYYKNQKQALLDNMKDPQKLSYETFCRLHNIQEQATPDTWTVTDNILKDNGKIEIVTNKGDDLWIRSYKLTNTTIPTPRLGTIYQDSPVHWDSNAKHTETRFPRSQPFDGAEIKLGMSTLMNYEKPESYDSESYNWLPIHKVLQEEREGHVKKMEENIAMLYIKIFTDYSKKYGIHAMEKISEDVKPPEIVKSFLYKQGSTWKGSQQNISSSKIPARSRSSSRIRKDSTGSNDSVGNKAAGSSQMTGRYMPGPKVVSGTQISAKGKIKTKQNATGSRNALLATTNPQASTSSVQTTSSTAAVSGLNQDDFPSLTQEEFPSLSAPAPPKTPTQRQSRSDQNLLRSKGKGKGTGRK